jgi:hypothetical protein
LKRAISSIASRKQLPSSIIAHPDEEKSYKFKGKEDLQAWKAALTPPDYFLGVKSQACDKIAAKGSIPVVFCRYRGHHRSRIPQKSIRYT